MAEEACRIEIDVLAQPVGKQDQYIAAFGGLTCFEFHPDDRVTASPLAIANTTLHDLEEHLLLFFTGYARSAASILQDQKERSTAKDSSMRAALDFTHELGRRIKDALERVLALDRGWQQGSADRALGRWYFKVPGLFGGSNKRAEAHLRRSLDYDPGSTVTHFFLAEVLIDENRNGEAREELQRVVDAPFNADWVAEDQDYKAQARARLATLK